MSTPQSTQTPRLTVAVYAAYTAAVLFALHLATYFVPSLRDVTLSTSAVLAVSLALLAVAQHVVVFPVVAVPCLSLGGHNSLATHGSSWIPPATSCNSAARQNPST